MKKTALMIILVTLLASGSLAFGQAGAIEGYSPQVQDRERQLLQGLTPEQLQMIVQNATLFEGKPEPGVDPQGVLQGLLAAPGIIGMDRDEAAFAVLAVAGRHLDEDLKEITGAINVLNESRLTIQKALGDLGVLTGSAASQQGLTGGKDKGRSGVPVDGEAAVTASSSKAVLPVLDAPMAMLPVQTAHYKIKYWKVAPLTPRAPDGLSRRQQLVEARLLRARLAELDGLLVRMTERFEHGMRRHRQFAQALEGMAQKERIGPQR